MNSDKLIDFITLLGVILSLLTGFLYFLYICS